MTNPIGIGVIGLGESGQHHIQVIQGDRKRSQEPQAPEKLDLLRAGRSFARRLLGRNGSVAPVQFNPGLEGFNIIGVADVDERRLAWATENFEIPHRYTDYRQLLAREDVEAVLVCTPPAFHPELTIEAARSGKHVLCEKPMALSSASCLEMLEAIEKAGIVFQVGYMLRFCSERGKIAESIRSNLIGRPVFYREIISLRAGGDQLWIHDQRLGGGPLWEVSHGIDFLRHVFGEPETVFGIGDRYKPNKTTALDTYVVSMLFPSGDKAVIGDSYGLKNFGWDNEACRKHRTEIDVIGSGGYIQFPDADLSNRLTICVYSDPEDRIEKIPWTSVWGADESGYRKQLEHFLECVMRRQAPAVSADEGLRTVELLETIMESIRSGDARKFRPSLGNHKDTRPVHLQAVRRDSVS